MSPRGLPWSARPMPDFNSRAAARKGLWKRKSSMPKPLEFAIELSRLPRVDNFPGPGLILLIVDTVRGGAHPTRVGALTDAALRGRLAYFDQHSANEIAAVRQTLGKEGGRATVRETWSGERSCLQFWQGFIGSQIRPFTWLCVKCGNNAEERVGGTVGELFAVRCKCGQVHQITVPK